MIQGTYVEMVDTWIQSDLIEHRDAGLFGLCIRS